MTAFYIVVGVVLYMYANPYIASPALGTAGVLVKRISYGIALPGLFFTAIIYNHLAAKFIFVRVLRGSYHLNHPTAKHWAVWLSCTGACLLFSYVVAEAIPVFSGLVGLVSALFGTMMALHAEVRRALLAAQTPSPFSPSPLAFSLALSYPYLLLLLPLTVHIADARLDARSHRLSCTCTTPGPSSRSRSAARPSCGPASSSTSPSSSSRRSSWAAARTAVCASLRPLALAPRPLAPWSRSLLAFLARRTY